MSNMIFLLYVIFATITACFLSIGTDRKVLSFVLILWLLAQPVINAKYIIPLPGLPFELQPNRILFLFALVYLLYGLIFWARESTIVNPPFEKYIYIYFVLVLFAVSLNYTFMSPKNVISVPLEIATFLTVYLLAKHYMTEMVFTAIIKAIVLLAVIGSIVAIVQISVDSMFLRTGDLRPAFGNKLRSTGIFQSEYDFGYFQILAFIVVLVRYNGKAVRFLMLPLLMLSVLLTFHRLDYIILFVCYLSYNFFYSKHKLPVPIYVVAGVLGLILIGLSVNLYNSMDLHSVVLEERLKEDTVTGRFLQYQVVWDSILAYPLGLGSYEHPDYVKLMSEHGMLVWVKDRLGNSYPMPLVVHNGYLAAGIRYGFLGMVIFTMLIFSMQRYSKKQIDLERPSSLILVYAVLIYAMSNLSNDLSIFRAYFVVLLAILSGASVALNRAALVKQPRIMGAEGQEVVVGFKA